MKNIVKTVIILFLLSSCQEEKNQQIRMSTDFKSRQIEVGNFNKLTQGKSYLSVYSHIYQRFKNRTFDLTTTVSIRNISTTDSIYILKADYFNTLGKKLRQYLQKPIFLKPMETVEIIIEEEDKEGGSGANFVFDWAIKNNKNPPLFEAVMISTSGQQGVSFVTRGLQIK